MNKFILYYSHNTLPIEMEEYFQHQLLLSAKDIPIVAVVKKWRSDFSSSFATENLKIEHKQDNWNSINLQTKIGIERIQQYNVDAIVYLAEHDVLYPPSYFLNDPENDKTFEKNKNLYFMNKDGFFGPHNTYIHSQTIGHSSLFLHCLNEECPNHFRFKTQNGYKLNLFSNDVPSIDVRHGYNYTGYRTPSEQKSISKEIIFWGQHEDLLQQIPHFKRG